MYFLRRHKTLDILIPSGMSSFKTAVVPPIIVEQTSSLFLTSYGGLDRCVVYF